MRAPSSAAPDTLDLVLLGGGHSHLSVLRRLAMRPWPGVRVTLVTRDVHTPYSGMLPGHLAGHYDFDAIHIDLGPLARAAGARLVHVAAEGLDLQRRRVLLPDRPPLRFDLLSINTGAAPALDEVEGARAAAVPVKPISTFVPRMEALLQRLREAGDVQRIAVVGAGAGGTELALALHERLCREQLRDRASLALVTAGGLLEGHPPAVVERFDTALTDAGVSLTTGFRVAQARSDALIAEDGRSHRCDVPLWVTQAAAPSWLATSGLAVDAQGFARVGATLQSLSHEDVFVAGDSAALDHVDRPRSGVFAVRAGPVLADNLERRVRGRRLRRWIPQRHAMYLITTGARHAVVSRPGWPALSGRWVWWWKRWIDRRFVRRFTSLPVMAAQPPASIVAGAETLPAMRCAGCGSKVGAGALGRVLTQLAGDVGETPAAFEDAAELKIGDTSVLQTVDGFRLPVTDPWLGGRITALHAMGDIQAMGATPTAALALATVPFAGSRQMEDDLYQMLAGARRELEGAGCRLLGGHSNEGDAPALALTISAAAGTSIWRKRGLQAGDELLLTRALGSGVLLAGAMAGQVRSRDLDAAIEAMLEGHGAVLAALEGLAVHAATDVTGFGLLGHLREMLGDGALRIDVDVQALPVHPGALDALASGLASSLQADNEQVLERCTLQGVRADEARVRLLCDPQTCGGLLLALPPASAGALRDRLGERGASVVAIGSVSDGTGQIVLHGGARH